MCSFFHLTYHLDSCNITMLDLYNFMKGVISMTLDQVAIGEHVIICKVDGEKQLRRRLLDMGLTPKTKVMIHKIAPLGDPIELHLRGYSLSIRLDDASKIEVKYE